MLRFEKVVKKLSFDSKIVEFKAIGREEFKISAIRDGIMILGPSPILKDSDDLNAVAQVVAEAWKEYQAMRNRDAQIQNTTLEAPVGGNP